MNAEALHNRRYGSGLAHLLGKSRIRGPKPIRHDRQGGWLSLVLRPTGAEVCVAMAANQTIHPSARVR